MKDGESMKLPFTLTLKRKEYLNHLGINNYFDLINHVPYRYDTYSDTTLNPNCHDLTITIVTKVVAKSKIMYIKGNMTKFTINLSKDGYDLKAHVFNRLFYYKNIKIMDEIVIKGKYDHYKKEITPTEIFFDLNILNEVKPLYSLPKGIKDSEYAKLVQSTLQYLIQSQQLKEIIPEELSLKYRLISRIDAYNFIHFPKNLDDVKKALRYLKYEELLLFSIAVNLDKTFIKSQTVKSKQKADINKMKEVINSLPYSLTDDQKQALNEIVKDLNSENVMYRLLQGDVGTGKTLVAAISMIGVAAKNYQSVLMVPTDILARQHYKSLLEITPKPFEVVLLVSNMNKKEKDEALKKIETIEGLIIIGTQALIQEKVNYLNLGYIIIDEQHRFGVNQRQALKLKGQSVDFLSMSATPIPRTLAISLYGDMDITILKQFPNKIRDIMTKVMISRTIKPLLPEILQTIKNDKRVYIVCSMIEGDNEEKRNVNDVYEGLQKYLGKYLKIGLLHGKLDDEEKIEEINKFKNGDSNVLVSTTVVEVGVDIKKATMMVIYDAEYFGLAQLHQLRGRIGRAGDKSSCYLLTTKNDEDTLRRLRFMEECNDGFELARFDLALRGPGELIGVKQSGLPSLFFASFTDDLKILDIAQKDAISIYKDINNAKYYEIYKKIKEEKNEKSIFV